jgi:hypothetical protein
VLTGKLLEQATLELEQEEEMKNIRQARTAYIAKLNKEKQERKEIEEVEIKRKNDFDNVKRIKKLDKFSKISTQQKLISRMFSKVYLQDFTKKTVRSMTSMFKNYSRIAVQDKYNNSLYQQVEDIQQRESEVYDSLIKIETAFRENDRTKHSEVVNAKKQRDIERKLEAERKRLEEDELTRIEKEKQVVRQKERAILRLHRDIEKEIFNNPNTKGEYNNEEITEIDNYENEGSYSIIINNIFSWCIWWHNGSLNVLTGYRS